MYNIGKETSIRREMERSMKRIAVSIQSRVFGESVLLRSEEFRPVRITAVPPERALRGCIAAHPALAREVMRAKQEGRIDAFFYASVTAGAADRGTGFNLTDIARPSGK